MGYRLGSPRLWARSLARDHNREGAQPGQGPGMARSVSGGALHRPGRFAFPFGNGLRPPLTAESLRPLRSETKGQAGACPDRTRAIPCKVQAVTKGGA